MPNNHDTHIGRPIAGVNIGLRPDKFKWNAGLTLTWSNDELIQIDATDGDTTVRQTLTWSNDELTTISKWTEI